MSDFQKKFDFVVKAWAVPAFVISVLNALVIEIPQIYHHIPPDIVIKLLGAYIESFAIVFISLAVGGPGGLLFGSVQGAMRFWFDKGSWKRKHYVTAFCIFVGLWILQAKVLFVRAELSIIGFSLFVVIVIGLVIFGVVSLWRSLPS